MASSRVRINNSISTPRQFKETEEGMFYQKKSYFKLQQRRLERLKNPTKEIPNVNSSLINRYRRKLFKNNNSFKEMLF